MCLVQYDFVKGDLALLNTDWCTLACQAAWRSAVLQCWCFDCKNLVHVMKKVWKIV